MIYRGLAVVLLVSSCSRNTKAVANVRPQRSTAASIQGTVTDGRGRAISGVAVIANSLIASGMGRTSDRSMALTDERGHYQINHLTRGQYELTFDPCQLNRKVVKLSLTRAERHSLDVSLGRGGVASSPRVAQLPTPEIAGGSSDARATVPAAGVGQSAEARRRLLAEAAGVADEIWIIARRRTGLTQPAVRRRYSAGLMCASVPSSGTYVPLPLGSTDVRARVSGHVASVDVEQHYVNPFREKLEAVYVFPLPDSAAVGEFVMTVGKRRIRGIVRDRDEAQRIYDEARAAGYVAALLTQQRPNVFTQRVANIEPGARIDIRLSYYHLLPYRDGAYSFVFPTVVGPRYTPSGVRDGIGSAFVELNSDGNSGTSRDEKSLERGSRRSTEIKYLPAGKHGKRRFSMSVDIEAGVPIESIASPGYAIDSKKLSASRRIVTLADGQAVPNKDFALRYRVAGDLLKSGFMVAKGRGERHFSFILQPPRDLAQRDREPLDLVVILDRSSTMRGDPARTGMRALGSLLPRLAKGDRFQFVIAGSTAGAAPIVTRASSPTRHAIARALTAATRGAGTSKSYLRRALKSALELPSSAGRERVIALVSDGYVGDEARLLGLVAAQGGRARILSVGIGTAVNRYFMERIARLGNGATAYLDPGDDASSERTLERLLQRLSHPVLTDIQLDFGAMEIRDVYPVHVPDLLLGQPVVVTGKLRGKVGPRVRVRGTVRGRQVSYELNPAPASAVAPKALANLWARMRITDLQDQAARGVLLRAGVNLADELRRIAREHGILGPASAVLGVDTRRPTAAGRLRQVVVPSPLPEGVTRLEQ